MASNQFCVFCGNRPKKKNKEHILPQWLIALTGKPSRVVDIALDYRNGKTISFSWSSFVAPACEKCNSAYANLECSAKLLVEKLIAREELTASEYILLLDWLDKTRIGLWLAYYQLQKNPANIAPHFHINSRIASKDRMLAVYLMQTRNIGMNPVGVEPPMFHYMPSCFMLNINNVAILNMSCDYLCAGRCGFPAPKVREWLLDDGGMLSFDEFTASMQVMHPILNRGIFKPSIHLYQPIMQRSTANKDDTSCIGVQNPNDEFLCNHTIPSSPNQGVLFRQEPQGVNVIVDLDTPIEYASVSMSEARPLYQLMAQTYDLQNYCHSLYDPRSSDSSTLEEHRRYFKRIVRLNQQRRNEIIRCCQQETDTLHSPVNSGDTRKTPVKAGRE